MKSLAIAVILLAALTFFAITLGHGVTMGRLLLRDGSEPPVISINALTATDLDIESPIQLHNRTILPIVASRDAWRCNDPQVSPEFTHLGREIVSLRVAERSCIESERIIAGGVIDGNLSLARLTVDGTVVVTGYSELGELHVESGSTACIVSFGDVWVDTIIDSDFESLTVVSTGGRIFAPSTLPSPRMSKVALFSAHEIHRGVLWSLPRNCLSEAVSMAEPL